MSETQEVAKQNRASEFNIFGPFGASRFIEYLVQMQKISLEVYEKQTTTAMESIRHFFPMVPAALIDSAQSSVAEMFRIQTQVLDSIAGRGKEYLESGEQAHFGDYGQISRLLTESANQFLSVHRKLVEIFANQLHNFAAAVIPSPIASSSPVSMGAELIQRNTELLMENQKKFWGLFLRA